jgi:hypothetical protein
MMYFSRTDKRQVSTPHSSVSWCPVLSIVNYPIRLANDSVERQTAIPTARPRPHTGGGMAAARNDEKAIFGSVSSILEFTKSHFGISGHKPPEITRTSSDRNKTGATIRENGPLAKRVDGGSLEGKYRLTDVTGGMTFSKGFKHFDRIRPSLL